MPIFQNSSKSLAKKESHSGQDLDSCVYRLGLSYFGDSLGFFFSRKADRDFGIGARSACGGKRAKRKSGSREGRKAAKSEIK